MLAKKDSYSAKVLYTVASGLSVKNVFALRRNCASFCVAAVKEAATSGHSRPSTRCVSGFIHQRIWAFGEEGGYSPPCAGLPHVRSASALVLLLALVEGARAARVAKVIVVEWSRASLTAAKLEEKDSASGLKGNPHP